MAGDGGMKHSLEVRKTLNAWLCSLLGKDFVDKWFIKVLPLKEDFQKGEKVWKDHWRRNLFFGGIYGLGFLTSVLLLEAIRCVVNMVIARKQANMEATVKNDTAEDNPKNGTSGSHKDVCAHVSYTPLLACEATDAQAKASTAVDLQEEEEEEEEAAERTRQRMKGYNRKDLLFAVMHQAYIFMCLTLASYAFLNDYLNKEYGLDFELYFPWVLGTLLWHIGCLTYVATVACITKKSLPCVATAPFISANPIGGYLGTLRDAVAGGVLAQYCFEDHDWPKKAWCGIFAFVTFVCIFLPNPFIYYHIHSFRDFQATFWPIVMVSERAALPRDRQRCEVAEGVPGETGQPSTCWWLWQQWVLPLFDSLTRWNKQAAALFGDVPQAIVWALFVCSTGKGCLKERIRDNCYIVFVTMLATFRSLFVWFARSRILCSMAYNDIPWGHLTVHEVGWAIRCEKFTYCSNEKKSKACRQLLKDEETTPEVRVAAMEALGKLYETHKGSKDELLTPTEIGKIRDTLMWEVAMSSENHTKKAASGVLERLVNDNNNSAQCEKSMKCACQLHRLRSDDPDEKKDAINILAREHPEFASAYVRDLAKLLTYVPRRRHNSGEGESQHGESHCKVEEEQRDKEWYNARRVREAAARALGSLCEAKAPDKNQELTEDQQKDQQKQRQDSVYKVADIVLEALCNEECPFISRTALTAVVGFRDEAAVRAVNRVMKLGKSAESLHCRGVAEIALVELLPRLPPNELQERADEVAQWLLDSDGNRSDMARRVLERLGGKAAEAAQGALSKLPRESQRTVRGLQELEAVLRCQAESAKSLEGTSIRGLNLVLRTDEDQLKRAREMVDKIAGMRGNVWGEIFKLLEAENIQHKTKGMSTDTETGTLPVFITDLEVDDTMFIAEMWAYLREQGQGRGVHKPLVVFCADVEHKDKEDLFAMKLLFAALMLGRVDFKILTAQPKPGQEAKKSELAADLAKQREGNIRDIADKIMQFRGEKVAYFICSPTRGNLEDIMVKLAVDPKEDKGKAKKDNGAKPTLREPEKRSVHMYTGMFNMKETTDEDIKALYTLVGKDTFIDLSKYPFFGYRESVVTNFTDFALPSFAPLLSHRYTLIAAVWRLLNDAFNTKLVSPEKVMEKVLPPDLEEKFSEAKVHYAKDMNKYAEILCTPKLLEHVVNKKKNTLKAFACGSCDVPLCDQLLFLREWARDHQPPVPRDLNNRPETEGTWISEISGTWVYNKKDGYTSVDTRPEVETMGLKAVQPVMREHRDAEALYRMREALQDYTFKHLELLYGENRC